MPTKTSFPKPILTRALATALLALPSLNAFPATGDFLSPYVAVSTRYDDNLFRLPDGTDTELLLGESHRSDWRRTAAAGLGIDWQPGRQQVSAKLEASDHAFDRFDFLDYTGFDTNARWQMAAGRRFTGEVRGSYTRSLNTFEDFRIPRKDLLDVGLFDLDVGYLITPDIEFTGGAGVASRKHDLNSQRESNLRSRYWLVSVSQRTPLGNRLGLEYRHDTGDYPNRDFTAVSVVDDGYQQQSVSVTGSWRGAFTQLGGSLGYARRDFDHLGERDYSGLVGELRLSYMYSPKLTLGLQGYRRLQSLDDLLSSSVIETGVAFDASWAFSDRLSLALKSEFRDREFQDSGLFAGASQPKERLYAHVVSVSYTPRTFLTLTAAVDQGQRNSDRDGFDYDYMGVVFLVQLNF